MKLKVCGLKDPKNIIEVAELKPEFMGFIFYSHSKRFVGEYFEIPLIPSEIKKVGVFVNSKSDYIIEKIDKYKLDLIQLHGDESPEYCAQFNHSTPVIKAFGLDEGFDFEILEAYDNCCTYFLFDTKTKEYGGSGKQFDWKIIEKYDNKKPFFLSGGIGLEEIKKIANCKLQIDIIDVNSKFETNTGLKNISELKKIKI
jgi:phosphoribosylanthranilate isomerase